MEAPGRNDRGIQGREASHPIIVSENGAAVPRARPS